jgi:RHS repeat-associated protein
MSGYGFTVDSSGYGDEDRGVGFQPAVQSQTHKCFSVASQSVTHDAIIARHSASQLAPAIDFQGGQQTIADYPSGTTAGSPTYTYVNTRYIDEPVSRGGSGGLRYYHRNQQYSITAVSDGGGSVVERYAYSAYGQVTIAGASGSVISNSAISNRYTYTGREWDEGLSLYHFRARMYDAVTGMFVSRDPIGYIDGANRYLAYFAPSYMDPTGELFHVPVVVVVVVVGIIVTAITVEVVVIDAIAEKIKCRPKLKYDPEFCEELKEECMQHAEEARDECYDRGGYWMECESIWADEEERCERGYKYCMDNT